MFVERHASMSVSRVDAVDADRSSRLAKTSTEKKPRRVIRPDRPPRDARRKWIEAVVARRAAGRGSRVEKGERSSRRSVARSTRDDDGAAEGTQSPRTFRGGGADRPRRARAAHAHRDPVAAGAPDVPAGQRRAARAPRALGPGARDGRDARRGIGEREHRGRCAARHEVMRCGTGRAHTERERFASKMFEARRRRDLRVFRAQKVVTSRSNVIFPFSVVRAFSSRTASTALIDAPCRRDRNETERGVAHRARRVVAARERLAVRGATSRAFHRSAPLRRGETRVV